MLWWAALAVIGTAIVEWLLVAWRVGTYFRAAFRLPLEPLPVEHPPDGEGQTRTVGWEARGEHAVYWSVGGLPGLHGAVGFVPDRGKLRLDVRWAPPWTGVAGCGALGFVGPSIAPVAVSVTVSVLLLVGLLVLYQQAAVRAAAELRWSWARRDED